MKKLAFRLFQTFSLSIICLSIISASENPEPAKPKMSYLDNGKIKLGVNLSIGGAVTFLCDVKKPVNLINSWDWGRQIQLSFYSGPIPFQPEGTTLAPEWKGLGWNPIQAGDHFHHGSKVISHTNNGKKIAVKCVPMIWPLDNVLAECTFETIYELKEHTVEVTCRLVNYRSDKTQHSGRDQELPAVYTNGPWYKLVSYLGDQPFTKAAPTVVVDRHDGKGWPWRNYYSPEHWSALLDSNNTGVGVFNPQSYRFSGGFAGEKGSGGPKDAPTGYASPLGQEILDYNIVYEYKYVLIVGNLNEIRDYAYAHTPKAALPVWNFVSDRQHWIYEKTTDEGWPIKKELKVSFATTTSAMISPLTLWRAEEAKTLFLNAAFETSVSEVQIFFEPFAEKEIKDFPAWGEGSEQPIKSIGPIKVPIAGNGTYKQYEIDCSQLSDYKGSMVRMKIVFPAGTGRAKVASVGFIKSK